MPEAKERLPRSMPLVMALLTAVAGVIDTHMIEAKGRKLAAADVTQLLEKSIAALEQMDPTMRDMAILGSALVEDVGRIRNNIDACLDMAKLAWVDVAARTVLAKVSA
jgi:hypothetical protein